MIKTGLFLWTVLAFSVVAAAAFFSRARARGLDGNGGIYFGIIAVVVVGMGFIAQAAWQSHNNMPGPASHVAEKPSGTPFALLIEELLCLAFFFAAVIYWTNTVQQLLGGIAIIGVVLSRIYLFNIMAYFLREKA